MLASNDAADAALDEAVEPPTSIQTEAERRRRALHAVLARGRRGDLPILLGPPTFEVRSTVNGREVTVERLMLAPEENDGPEHAVPVVLCYESESSINGGGGRRNVPAPAVAFLHGTGGDTEGLLDRHLAPLAARGYVAVGVDAPCHGRRLDPDGGSGGVGRDRGGGSGSRPGGHGHGTASQRDATFERYGAALVAAFSSLDAREGPSHPGEIADEGSSSEYSPRAQPFLYDGAWDTLRALRWLVHRRSDATRVEMKTSVTDDAVSATETAVPLVKVDPGRVAVSGISLGGMYSWLAAAADSTIVKAAAPIIGVQDFGWGVANDSWRARVLSLPPRLFSVAAAELAGLNGTEGAGEAEVTAEVAREVYARITPGLCGGAFDGPNSLPLIAPRPLLVVNGELDPRNPMGGVEGVVAATSAAYLAASGSGDIQGAGRDGRFRVCVQRGVAHECTDEMVEVVGRWLDETLRPATPERGLPPPGEMDRVTWREMW